MSAAITRCRACEAEIFFAKTERGKWIPIDAKPNLDGNLEIIAGGSPILALPVAPLLPPAKRYKSHFATCPNAGQFRRRS